MSELQYALDRMSTPLDPSLLSGATADEDARCMGIIRAEIERLQRIVDEDLGRASEREAKLRAEVLARTRERDEARAERDAMAKQGETFRRLVDACKLLSSEAEEYEFDDGMGRGAMLDYWYEFDRKLDAALAQQPAAPSGEAVA